MRSSNVPSMLVPIEANACGAAPRGDALPSAPLSNAAAAGPPNRLVLALHLPANGVGPSGLKHLRFPIPSMRAPSAMTPLPQSSSSDPRDPLPGRPQDTLLPGGDPAPLRRLRPPSAARASRPEPSPRQCRRRRSLPGGRFRFPEDRPRPGDDDGAGSSCWPHRAGWHSNGW